MARQGRGNHNKARKKYPGRSVKNGRSAGIRTLDPVIKSHLLYQLSYAPISQVLSQKNGAS